MILPRPVAECPKSTREPPSRTTYVAIYARFVRSARGRPALSGRNRTFACLADRTLGRLGSAQFETVGSNG
ncbi:hypothetical protein CUJ87_31980 (plasmid) [Paraburkholderia caledonica]|nr:hypothetical protein CUJ87_31980 [Paraburkholderia caledonica]